MSNEEKQFEVYAVPYRKPFVVAKDKVEAFKNQKPNPEVTRQIEEMAETFRINNMTKGPVLRRKIK